MQITLPNDLVQIIYSKSEAAGFGDQIDAYVAHLITSHEPDEVGGPEHLDISGKGRAAIEEMLEAGYRSGPATPMTSDDWKRLHERVDELAAKMNHSRD